MLTLTLQSGFGAVVNGNLSGTLSPYLGAYRLSAIAFKDDGSKLYVFRRDGFIVQYAVTSPFEISGATPDGVQGVPAIATLGVNALLMPTEDYIFVIGSTNVVYRYDMSTPWDIESATLAHSKTFTETTVMAGLAFNSDGTTLLLLGSSSRRVYQYTLSTPYNLTTATYTSKYISVFTQDNTPQSIAVDSTGTKLYMVGSNTDTIYLYKMSVAWDISTATFSGSRSVASYSGLPVAVAVKPDNTKLYVCDYDLNKVFQFNYLRGFP